MTMLGVEPPVALIPNRIAFQNFAAIWVGLIRHPDFLQGNNGFLNRVRAQLTQRQREIEQEPRAVRTIIALIAIFIFISNLRPVSSYVPENLILSLSIVGILAEIGVRLYNFRQNIQRQTLIVNQARATNPDEHEDNDESQGPRL
jgi:hypothetical protein